jgi:hypothetical protein
MVMEASGGNGMGLTSRGLEWLLLLVRVLEQQVRSVLNIPTSRLGEEKKKKMKEVEDGDI